MPYIAKVGYQLPEGVFNAGQVVPDELVEKYKLSNVKKTGGKENKQPATAPAAASAPAVADASAPADDGVESAAAASEAKPARKSASKK